MNLISSQELAGKQIIIGISGGIAAYKIPELIRLLTKAGASVQVAMTEAAQHFVTATTLQALSGKTVFIDQWDTRIHNQMAHINLSRIADLILVAPASADFLAKVAHGQANDLLSTLCLARSCPLLLAPSMNVQMWRNPATQRNVSILENDHIDILGPDSGEQACGEIGEGRMLEPHVLFEIISSKLQPKPLENRRVLITAGPTFEAMDPIRGLTNHSSGKMGFALARLAEQAGAKVHLIAGPVSQTTPWNVRRENVQSAEEMYQAVLKQIPSTDIFISVAAVADWRPSKTASHKIKKQDNQQIFTIQLSENVDILAKIAALPNSPFCVGFAAESADLMALGEEKRKRKNIPMLISNIGPLTFGQDDNEVVIFESSGVTTLRRSSKQHLAKQLIELIAKRYIASLST